MAFDQISTSVTIINSGLIGYMGVSLTNYTTSAASAIAAGSAVEIAGAFFKASGDITVNASSWTAITTATTAYLALTPSGTAGSQTLEAAWTSTAPVWVDSKCGWYATAGSSTRVIGSCYKMGTSSYGVKTLYIKGQDRIFSIKVSIGSWDMDTNDTLVLTPNFVSITSLLYVTCVIAKDTLDVFMPLHVGDGSGNAAGTITVIPPAIYLYRYASSTYDSVNYSSTSVNRGYVVITYEA